MEIAKYIFIIVASVTLFGIFGGLNPDNSIAEMAVRAIMVGLVFAGIEVFKQVKDEMLARI
jgi:hypothetical protein